MTTRKLIFAFTLVSIGLAGLAVPGAQAAPIVSGLAAGGMPASRFNELFAPIAAAPTISAAYQFMRTPVSGSVVSQAFEGRGAAAGLYAYAYQFVVDPVVDADGQRISLNSAAIRFDAPAASTNLVDKSLSTYSAYLVRDGAIGGIAAPMGSPTGFMQDPRSIVQTMGAKSGALTFQFLDPRTGGWPLEAGSRSATIVVLASAPFTTQPVSLQNANPQISYPTAYAPTVGDVPEIPVPEPATILGWSGLIAGGAWTVRRRTRNRRTN